MRRIVSLLDTWGFAESTGSTRPAPDTFQEVPVPHDFVIAQDPSEDAPLSAAQGFFPRGTVGWYRKSIHLQPRPDRCSVLDFEGVSEQAEVYVNGHLAAKHAYAYSPFRVDITPYLIPGDNEILVRADASLLPADRWYSGAGIFRAVRLIEMDLEHLDEKSIETRVRFSDASATVCVSTGIQMPVTAALKDQEGCTVASGEGRGELSLTVPSPRLWSAEDPYLYTLSLRLVTGDEVSLRLGLRTAEFRPREGLFINGQHVRLRGICVHQDLGCEGMAMNRELWADRLHQLKELGCNAIRCAHHQYPSDFLDLCDEMGFYVYAEAFDKWHSGLYGRYFEEHWREDLEELILRDRHRPCILIWGVGNEVENQGQPSMLDTLKMLTDRAHALDPTRPVSYAMNPHFKRERREKIDLSRVLDIQKYVDEADEQEIEDLDERLERIGAISAYVDIISCNYQEQWFPEIHRRIPSKPILATESYPYFLGHPQSMQNYTQELPALTGEREGMEYVLGTFIWTGYDYLGESMGWPSRGWTGSLLRLDGTPRFSFHLLKSFWRDEPMVHLSVYDASLSDEMTKGHWASPPFEDVWDFPALHQGVVPYMIAARCERVEIHMQGKVFHAAVPASHCISGFLPWLPGRVEVRGITGDRVVCTHVLETPSAPSRLAFSPPARQLLPGEKMLLTVSVTDDSDILCIRDAREISFRAHGAARILSAMNADLMDHTPFTSSTWKSWHGRASVVVLKTGDGEGSIEAVADGLPSATLNL